ncbi:MAG TPA: PAS domain S-box protein [Chloroflexota bacterium]|nr:PAS domain S-box protein [Chloroflexota bacterium]
MESAASTAAREDALTGRGSAVKALAELTRLAASGADLAAIANMVVDDARALTGCDFAALLEIHPDQTFSAAAVVGSRSDTWNQRRAILPAGPFARAMRTGRAVVQHRTDSYPAPDAQVFSRDEGAETFIAAPVIASPGVLYVGWRRHVEPTDRQVSIAEALASAAGTILAGARARSAQAEQSAQLMAIMEHIPSAVILTDRGGRPVRVSDSVRKITGADADPALPFFSPTPHQQASMIRSAITGQALASKDLPTARALAGQRDVKDILLIRPPGQPDETCLMVSSTPLRDANNAITGALTVMTDMTHETMLQRQVKTYADQLERVYDTMACGVMVVSRNGPLYANKAGRRMLGLPPDGPIALQRHLIGTLLNEDGDELPPDERPGRSVLRTGQPVHGLMVGHRLPSGEVLWTQEDAVPITDEQGNVELAVVSFSDVTERRETRQALEDQFEFLRATMASLADGIYAADDEGRLVMMNRAAEEMLGWTQTELFGRRLHEAIHYAGADGSPLSEDECVFRKARAEGVTIEGEDVFVRRDGTPFPISHRSSPLWSRGKISGIVTAFRDISEQKRAYDALRASEDRYRAIVETAFEGVWTIDLQGNTTFANAQMAHLLGCSVEHLYSANLFDFIDDELKPAVQARLKRRHAGLSERYESRFRRVDGSAVWALASACPLRGPEGEVVGSLAMITDITERKNLEAIRRKTAELEAENERIANAGEVRARFLATMSHELRSPLNSIIGMAELLNRGSFGPLSERQQEMTGRLLNSSEHLLRLVNGVLDLAKIEAGKLEFEPEPVSLRGLVSETAATLALQAQAREVRLTTRVQDGLDHAYLDATRLRQVLYNYLSNAIKFSPSGGEVAVELTLVSADRFRIDVRDEGPGIPAEDLPKLFREFQQLPNGSSGKDRGSGLGLAITKRIVEAEGGQVGVSSEPGRGSAFYAILPLRYHFQETQASASTR